MVSKSSLILVHRIEQLIANIVIPSFEDYLLPYAYSRPDNEPIEMLKKIYPIEKIEKNNCYELMEIELLMSPKGLSHYIPLSIHSIIANCNVLTCKHPEEFLLYGDWFDSINYVMSHISNEEYDIKRHALFDLWSISQKKIIHESVIFLIEVVEPFEEMEGFKQFAKKISDNLFSDSANNEP